jgi:hypothetical protein
MKGDGRLKRPADLCSGFGTTDPTWVADPSGVAVPDAILAFFSHQVAAHLRATGIRPRTLTESCGGTESAWRSKLNGTRAFHLSDLVTIAVVLDPSILDVIPCDIEDLTTLVPPPYGPLLSHHRAHGRMPWFASPDINWTTAAAELDQWWSRELTAGRTWAITREVLLHRTLVELDDLGLPSDASARLDVDDDLPWTDVVWPARSVRLRVLWLNPHDPADGIAVASSLTTIGDSLWGLVEASEYESTIAVVAAAPSVLANFRDIGLPPRRRDTDDLRDTWVTMSLQHAHRLQMTERDPRSDLHLRWINGSGGTPLCLMLKS